MPVPDAARDAPRRLFALTSKPILYVANVEEGVEEVPAAVAEHARGAAAVAVAISARIEVELGELGDEAEAAEMRAELGIAESGLQRLIAAAFELLDLMSSSPPARTRRRWPGRCVAARPPGRRPARSTARSSRRS